MSTDKINYCFCGCGEIIPEGSTFKRGHHAKAKALGLLDLSGKIPLWGEIPGEIPLCDEIPGEIPLCDEITGDKRKEKGIQIMTEKEQLLKPDQNDEAKKFLEKFFGDPDGENNDPIKDLETAKYIIHSVFESENLGSTANLTAEEATDLATADYLNLTFQSPLIAKFKDSYLTYSRSVTKKPENILSGFFNALKSNQEQQGGKWDKFTKFFNRQ
jgi:hypothetical protein